MTGKGINILNIDKMNWHAWYFFLRCTRGVLHECHFMWKLNTALVPSTAYFELNLLQTVSICFFCAVLSIFSSHKFVLFVYVGLSFCFMLFSMWNKYYEWLVDWVSADGTCTTVFFNLFVAAEPWTSMEVTHGTPCIDPCVQRDIREVEATGCLRTHFPSTAKPLWGRQSKQRWPILNLTTLTGSSTLLYLT